MRGGPARCASGVARMAAAGLAVWLGAAATAASAADEEGRKRPPPRGHSTVEGNVAGESTFLDAPPFPGLDITDAFRLQLETFAAPDAPVGSGHASLVRPELGARATWPVNDRLLLRLAGQVAESRYRFRGDVWGAAVDLPAGLQLDADRLIGDHLDLRAARLALEGAYRLIEGTDWLADGERWSAVGSGYVGSRWEDGAFDSGLATGGAIGLGYEIPESLRVALGVSLRTSLDEGGLDVSPLFSLRWRPTERVTLRTRELGLQVEVELTPVLEVYLTGFRSSDGYRLRDRIRPLGDLTFRDRRVRVGVGFDWNLANWLHLDFELGAIVERRLRVREEHLGTLLSRRGEPSAYLEIHFDVRL